MRRRLNDKPDSGGGGGSGYIPAVVAMKTGVFGGGIGAAHLMNKKEERDAQNKREADAEMKRESRGVKMPANFGMLEEAKQDVKDTKDREKIKSMGYNKGGVPESDTTTGDFDSYRKQKQGEIAGRQASLDAANQARDNAKSKAVYDQSVKKYEREKILNPDGVSKSLDKGLDNIGDKVRSVGEFFGSNRMTSMDDKAQMKARKDVKGYAGGGMTASKRADGIAQRGKTRGKMC
jgi:hypothetical protein